ncbi:hypothetical protein D3C76_1557040 [compost metagenome]
MEAGRITAVEALILLPVLFGALLLVFLCLEQCGGFLRYISHGPIRCKLLLVMR